jgi:hypothetical protein
MSNTNCESRQDGKLSVAIGGAERSSYTREPQPIGSTRDPYFTLERDARFSFPRSRTAPRAALVASAA